MKKTLLPVYPYTEAIWLISRFKPLIHRIRLTHLNPRRVRRHFMIVSSKCPKLGIFTGMKTSSKARHASSRRTKIRKLTLGELIASTYRACGERVAPRILKLALNSDLVRLAPQPSH